MQAIFCHGLRAVKKSDLKSKIFQVGCDPAAHSPCADYTDLPDFGPVGVRIFVHVGHGLFKSPIQESEKAQTGPEKDTKMANYLLARRCKAGADSAILFYQWIAPSLFR
jgi:hypothetical protein